MRPFAFPVLSSLVHPMSSADDTYNTKVADSPASRVPVGHPSKHLPSPTPAELVGFPSASRDQHQEAAHPSHRKPSRAANRHTCPRAHLLVSLHPCSLRKPRD